MNNPEGADYRVTFDPADDTISVEPVTDGQVLMSDIIGAALTMAASLHTPPTPPKRGSEPYREAIRAVCGMNDTRRLTDALVTLWKDYGWRGPLDVMTEFVIIMDAHPHAGPACRDITGAVDIGSIIILEPDEETRLALAAQYSRAEDFARGQAPHEAFRDALHLTERAAELGAAWRPALNAAFRTAESTFRTALIPNPARNTISSDVRDEIVEDLIATARRKVFADLCKGPNRTDKSHLIQIALLVGTAAQALNNLHELTEKAERLPKGTRFIGSDGAPSGGRYTV